MASPTQPTTCPTNTFAFDTTAHFEKVASTYEDTAQFMKEVASHLLDLSTPLTSNSIILDNASGPGIVTGQILRLPQFTSPNSSYPTIHATDFSPAMIRALESRSRRDNWPAHVVHAQAMDAMDLHAFAANTFTHIYMASAIFIIPDPVKAVAEMKRTLQPGGTAVVTSFEKQETLEIFQHVQQAVRPEVELWKGPLPAEWLTEGKLREVMIGGGFEAGKLRIERYTAYMRGEEWLRPGPMELMETFSKLLTDGWAEEDKSRFQERLKQDIASEAVRSKNYAVMFFVALATK